MWHRPIPTVRDSRETLERTLVAEFRLATIVIRDPIVIAIAPVDSIEQQAAPPIAFLALCISHAVNGRRQRQSRGWSKDGSRVEDLMDADHV